MTVLYKQNGKKKKHEKSMNRADNYLCSRNHFKHYLRIHILYIFTKLWTLGIHTLFLSKQLLFRKNTDTTSLLSPFTTVITSMQISLRHSFIWFSSEKWVSIRSFEKISLVPVSNKYSWCNHFFQVLIRSPLPVRNT